MLPPEDKSDDTQLHLATRYSVNILQLIIPESTNEKEKYQIFRTVWV